MHDPTKCAIGQNVGADRGCCGFRDKQSCAKGYALTNWG